MRLTDMFRPRANEREPHVYAYGPEPPRKGAYLEACTTPRTQGIGPCSGLSAVRGIEGSDMGSYPFDTAPAISVWRWVSDLVLGPSSQRKGEYLNHHGRLACMKLLAINLHCGVFVLELVVSAL